MIIDAFLANDEQDLVQLRLRYLEPVVDVAFIGEAVETFAGRPKALNFESFDDGIRVVHVAIPRMTPPPRTANYRWHREEFQREYFMAEVQRLSNSEDVILFCDVDEIPSTTQVLEAAQILSANPTEFVNLATPVFFRRINWKVPSLEDWSKSKAFRNQVGFPGIRYRSGFMTTTQKGAHFSYLGLDAQSMKKKYSDFSHSEMDTPVASDPSLLRIADAFGVAHTGNFRAKDWGLLSEMGHGELGDVQLFAHNYGYGQIGISDFKRLPKISRIAASRRITLAISKSDINMLNPESSWLEILNLVLSMFSIRLFQYLRSAVRLLVRVALGARRFESLSFKYQLRKMS